ncbi:arabinogalactan peptide 23-like [Cucurbita maxima]|uniref:Arabinogalactan peptide 23-like n=2 Tax=Cucurbita TaxID=3660 RepID=A0A6J1HQG2_CUCMA|nr:arabinogalactan peptide 23-like [Cucurbita moschata]XP_022965239.1 arabinogalactan peptide 23-like [Cucurbita maxima]
MEMKKITCAVLFAAATVTAAVAQNEASAPAPGPTSAATVGLPAIGSLIGASLLSVAAYYLQ